MVLRARCVITTRIDRFGIASPDTIRRGKSASYKMNIVEQLISQEHEERWVISWGTEKAKHGRKQVNSQKRRVVHGTWTLLTKRKNKEKH